MPERAPADAAPLIERTPTRALFAQLLSQALGDTGMRPSPMATAYLIELLDERVRATPPDEDPATLAEAWLEARRTSGAARIGRLRRLGDRALFVSGYFAESLLGGVVSGSYYRAMGRSAYASLAASLAPGAQEPGWPRLFEELADRFAELALLLGEVGDRAHRVRPEWLLGLYERYLCTGSARDRRRLVRAGCLPPVRGGRERWQ